MSHQVNKKPPLEPIAGGGALQVNGPSPDGRRNSIIDTEEKIQRARAAGENREEVGGREGSGRVSRVVMLSFYSVNLICLSASDHTLPYYCKG